MTPDHLEAAGKVVDAIGLRQLQEPLRWPIQPDTGAIGMKAFAETLVRFSDKYLTMDRIRPVVARAYAERFDDDDLHALAAFYSSPTGKKTIRFRRELDLVQRNLVTQVIAAHLDELDIKKP